MAGWMANPPPSPSTLRQLFDKLKGHLLACPKAPAAIFSFIESAYVLSNLFPSKPSVHFLARKPFSSQSSYSSW